MSRHAHHFKPYTLSEFMIALFWQMQKQSLTPGGLGVNTSLLSLNKTRQEGFIIVRTWGFK